MTDDISNCVPTGSFLKTPIKISELLANGSHFDVNEIFDEEGEMDVYDNDDVQVEMSSIVSPWTKSFDELKVDMVQINEFLWKKLIVKGDEQLGPVPDNARVFINYNAHWEFEGVPFDSSQLRKSNFGFYTGRGEVLPGIEEAVRTMCAGEEAWFVLGYQLLFGELGCPPRILPKADGLYVLTVKSFNEVGNLAADKDLTEDERRDLSIVLEKVKDINKKGADFFQQSQYGNAVHCYEHAASVLIYSHIKDAKEFNEQSEWLTKLHTNLLVCNNKLGLYKKCIQHVAEIRRLTDNKPACKVLLHEGRALVKLGEYTQAWNVLSQAQKMQPQDKKIAGELRALSTKHKAYQESSKGIWTKAFGLKENTIEKPKTTCADTENESAIDWEEALVSFKNDEDVDEIELEFPEDQKGAIEEICKRLEVKLRIASLDEDSYIFSKK